MNYPVSNIKMEVSSPPTVTHPPSLTIRNSPEDTTVSSTASPPADSSLQITASGRVRKRPLLAGKPAYSYISLICMAMQHAPGQQATLKEIISFIEQK